MAVYKGSENFQSSEATLSLTVERINTNLSLIVPKLTFDKNSTVQAVLTDSDGNPVQNASLELRRMGRITGQA